MFKVTLAFHNRGQSVSFSPPPLDFLDNTALSVASTFSNGGSSSSCINIDEYAPRDIAGMEEWATTCGVQKADGFTFTNGEGYGGATEFGVGTELDILAEEPVLFVPNQMIITGAKAREEYGPLETAEGLFERLQTTKDLPHFYVFLKVLKEYESGTDSPWYYWLNSLPRYFSNGSSMTHLCSDLLPPLVGSLVSLERVRFRQFFRALKHVDFLPENIRSDKALAKWAFAIVYTRSFPLYPDAEGNYQDVQLVPMVDMVRTKTTNLRTKQHETILTQTRNIDFFHRTVQSRN